MSDPDSPAPAPEPPPPPLRRRLRHAWRALRGHETHDPAPLSGAAATPESDAQQRTLLANVRRMGDMRVSDAMVPRADVVAVEAGIALPELVEKFREAGHSRLPVFRETLDDPLGFVHVKDLFLDYAGTNGEDGRRRVEDFHAINHLRRTLTVPPSMPCGTLLQAMQAQRMHMALVIDEYGGTDGLVTIEDLLELIVGDIEDEHDSGSGPGWTRDPDGSWRVSARAYLDEFEAAAGVALLPAGEEDVDTLGGLVFTLCNRVPARSEVVVHPDGHEFEVLDADARRVKRLRVRLVEPVAPAETPPPALEAAQ